MLSLAAMPFWILMFTSGILNMQTHTCQSKQTQRYVCELSLTLVRVVAAQISWEVVATLKISALAKRAAQRGTLFPGSVIPKCACARRVAALTAAVLLS